MYVKGVGPKVAELLAAKGIQTAEDLLYHLALHLARFFDNSPEFWLDLQQMHDLTKAKLALAKTTEAEVRVYHPKAA
jgi:plasmid maintenance system antidote protein VapI